MAKNDVARQMMMGAAIGAVAGAAVYSLTRKRVVAATVGPQGRPTKRSPYVCAAGIQEPGGCTTTFPEVGPERDAYILSRVKSGDFEVTWLPVKSSAGGHDATFWVSGDALKIDGVRVDVSALLQQQIADLLGVSLMTPKIADLAFVQAPIRLQPMPRPITATTAAMIDYSKKLDAAIAQKTGPSSGKIVQTIGKTWTISNGLLAHPGRAENYGWHMTQPMSGVPNDPSASHIIDPLTGKPVLMIQSQGWAHDAGHVDYSQLAQFVLHDVVVDQQPTTLAAVLSDPALAPLASHEGVVHVLRQPGVSLTA